LGIGFLFRVCTILSENGIEYKVLDQRQTPEKQHDWKHNIELRPYQEDAMNAILKNQSGIIESPTGSGKTILAAVAVCEFGLPTSIVVSTKVIHQQFVEVFQDKTDIPIGVIASGKCEESPVQICICKSLLQGGKPHPALAGKQLLICDEVHLSASKQWESVVNGCGAYHRIGFSATPFRDSDLECNILAGIAGEVIYKIGTEELQADGYLAQADIRMIHIPCSYDRQVFVEPEKKGEPDNWRDATFAEKYRKGIVENQQRNQAIADICNFHTELGKKVLLIVSWIEHADKLLPMVDLTRDLEPIFLSGNDSQKQTKEKRERFINQSGGLLIGTAVIDLGFDVPSLDVVVMAAGGEFEGRTRQRFGRGLRPSPGKEKVTVFDFRDDDRKTGGRPMFWQHSKKRVEAYKEIGQKPVDYAFLAEALTD
jgi:superfamily II DNA or RNA helicase